MVGPALTISKNAPNLRNISESLDELTELTLGELAGVGEQVVMAGNVIIELD